MKIKNCEFHIKKVMFHEFIRLPYTVKKSPPAVDKFDAKFLCIAALVCHSLNLCTEKGVFPQNWKTAKVMPLVLS